MSASFHPALPLVLAFVAMPWVGMWGRRLLAVLAPAVALWWVIALNDNARLVVEVIGYDWVALQMTPLSRLFAIAFALYGLLCGIYAWTQTESPGKAWSMLLVTGGVGVTLAGDWLTLYLFWEMLAVASAFLVWLGRDPDSQGAGFRYIIFHIIGGMCLLGGALYLVSTGHAQVGPVPLDSLGAWLLLVGMTVNAAVVPLHAWLPDAYPRATVYGTVFLAAFTTKSAVYTLARGFAGVDLLMWAGAIMAMYGVYFALLENNIKRLLSYHIVSQVGYMVCGVGIGTALAIDGAAGHAFCHIFYKGLLLMSAGAVVYATGRSKLSDLGQLAGPMKWTLVAMTIGAFSISGVPLFNGFVSKALTISAAAKTGQGTVELLLLFASMGTFLSITMKLIYFTFLGDDHGARVGRPVPRSMIVSMAAVAVICIFTGVPGGYQVLYANLPFPATAPAPAHDAPHAADHGDGAVDAHPDTSSAHDDHGGAAAASAARAGHGKPAQAKREIVASAAGGKAVHYAPYTADHVVGSLQLLIGTALGFWLLVRLLKPKPVVSLDVDRLYRRPLAMGVEAIGAAAQWVGRQTEGATNLVITRLWQGVVSYRDMRRHVALAHQLAVIMFVLAAVAYFALYLMR